MTNERIAERVRAASYGTVLVIAALGVTNVADVGLGYSAELVLGVGVATWIAHLYAELLGRHVVEHEPLRRTHVTEAMADGSPILLATLLPATVLLIGRGDLLDAGPARTLALVVAFAQLLGIGAVVARRSPGRSHAGWLFAAATAGIGIGIGVVSVLLGH